MQTSPNILLLLAITLLLLLHSITSTTRGSKGNESDYEALLAIKAQMDDPQLTLSSWNKSLHFCSWDGVYCGVFRQRVFILDLSFSSLAGSLSPFIGNLSFLHELYLSNNLFSGNIPHQISFLRRLNTLNLQNNYFTGEIPARLSNCTRLKSLSLSHNNLTGEIPFSLLTLPSMRDLNVFRNQLSGRLQEIGIGNMTTSLTSLYLGFNRFQGSIPVDIGRFKDLKTLGLSGNLIQGIIPPSLFNLSNLDGLDLSSNNIHGDLPQDLGFRLPRLSKFYIENCFLSGQFPVSISNLSRIVLLELSFNSFRGKFSFNGNNMPNLVGLYAQNVFSVGLETRDLSFLDTLTNCSSLEDLFLSSNSFIGNLPPSILNLSTTLKRSDLAGNQITGEIPFGFCRFVNLYVLWLDSNYFTGHIPVDIGKMSNLQALVLSSNNLSGEIPSYLGGLTNLNLLALFNNNLQGSLPESLGNCTKLQNLFLNGNNFSGSFPGALFRASSLVTIRLAQNGFQGSFPIEIGGLKNLDSLDASKNRFSGEIPSTLGECTTLAFLDMSQNSFVGSIPESFSSLRNIQTLNLSFNKISGQIPDYFIKWPSLSNLNLSYNNLNGEVPKKGIFANMSVLSIAGNDRLCGGVAQLSLPKCSVQKKGRVSLVVIIISITCAMIVVVSIVSLCFYFHCCLRKKKRPLPGPENIKPFLEVSYQMLHVATNGFSLSNLVGVGGFGSVYKGTLHQDGDTELAIAVKVMNLQTSGAGKSFIAECKALRNIRHRNLVKVITACSSIDSQRNDFKALVYEFIPKGSLEHWLHSPDLVHGLSLLQRISIAIDVASALQYLHIECANPIVHCDLKPSNILLDDDMTARVSDFGLAKFVSGASTSSNVNDASSTQVRGTVGYVAPEYGIGNKISPEGDMYSLGIVILELMTSKKPTNPMFNNGLNLHDFAKSTLPNQVMEIIDHKMLGEDEVIRSRNAADIKKRECIKSIVMVGVQCSMEVPYERMSVMNVVNELKSARKDLFLVLGRRT